MMKCFSSFLLNTAAAVTLATSVHGKTSPFDSVVAHSSPQYGKEISRPFTNVAKKATPAVVCIKAEIESGHVLQQSPFNDFHDELFHRFFGRPRQPYQDAQLQPQISQGSGFIISEDGYIVTNYHVVKNAKTITVLINNNVHRELEAKFIGGDPDTDIAVIKMEGSDFPYLTFGDSDELEVGEWVMAIGTPLQLEATVSAGIVSAKGRRNLQLTALEDFIQTDTVSNPGSSGGALLNLDGQVVGMTTAILTTGGSGAYIGVTFAIPSNIIQIIQQQLVENGKVCRGFLGVGLQEIDSDLAEAFHISSNEGAVVTEVVKDSPAEKAGLEQGDIIIALNGAPVRSTASLHKAIQLLPPGSTIDLTLLRNGKKLHKTIQITERRKNACGLHTEAKLGFSVEDLSQDNILRYHLSPSDEGVVIADVEPGSYAAKLGLRPGFMILAVNHRKVKNTQEFQEIIENMSNAKRVLLLVKLGNAGVRFFSLPLKR